MYLFHRKTNESDFTKSVIEIGLNWVRGIFGTFALNKPMMQHLNLFTLGSQLSESSITHLYLHSRHSKSNTESRVIKRVWKVRMCTPLQYITSSTDIYFLHWQSKVSSFDWLILSKSK